MSSGFAQLISFYIICCSINYGQNILINTTLGQIRGTVDSNSWKPTILYEFKGIAYATPPLGNLRFRPAVLNSTKWNGVYNATEFGSVCIQEGKDADSHEDCLFLNIWTTKSNIDNVANNQLVPVMLFIHGGSFTGGTGNDYDGTNFVGEYGQFVYVSINYRLGALGFLNNVAIYNENPNWKSYGGLNGLHDQIVALQWVKQNIQSYGGDPNQVTIFGESAGAESVCMLLISPLAKNLFQRAIAESGSCIGPWQTQNTSFGIELGNNALTAAGYPINNLTYLRSVPADTFNSNMEKGGGVYTSVDQLVLTDLPINLYVPGTKLNAADSVIFGFNSMDGLVWYGGDTPINDTQYKQFIAEYISNTTQQNAIYNIYYPPSEFPENYAKHNRYQLAWDTINSDVCVACPTLQIGDIMVNNKMTSRIYIYEFFGSGSNGIYYAPHGSELAFVFDFKGQSVWYDMPWDQNCSDSMLSAWNNFGKYGKPNITNKFEKVNINWNEFSFNDRSVILFKGGDGGISNVDNFRKTYRNNVCDFWWYEVGWQTMLYVCADAGQWRTST